MAGEFTAVAQQLMEAGRAFHTLGMVPATSGNFSARLDDGTIAITVSGTHKGYLTENDIMRVSGEGISLDSRKPSAETGLHVQIYNRFPSANAILHPHSRSATLTARLPEDSINLCGYELLKAFEGITTHEKRMIVPIFENDQDITRLARRVEEYMDQHHDTLAYIIRGHGFYSWASSVSVALRHCEALEFLLQCEIMATHTLTIQAGARK